MRTGYYEHDDTDTGYSAMKMSIQLAGLCASGTFILTALPGFYQQVKPANIASMATEAVPGMNILETLAISLVGAVLAGFIGYVCGDILANPKGGPKQKKSMNPQSVMPLTMDPEEVVAMPATAAKVASVAPEPADPTVVASPVEELSAPEVEPAVDTASS